MTIEATLLSTPLLVGGLISWHLLHSDWLFFLSLSCWGSRMSRYLETIRTEMKYTTANARNCACLLSSCRKGVPIQQQTIYSHSTTILVFFFDNQASVKQAPLLSLFGVSFVHWKMSQKMCSSTKHTPAHLHSPHHGKPQLEGDWCPRPVGGDQGLWWGRGCWGRQPRCWSVSEERGWQKLCSAETHLSKIIFRIKEIGKLPQGDCKIKKQIKIA